ncbi:MAG: hypothetical protein ABSG74_08065 [Candidatus Bathyarchaeia archaeon]
MQRIRITAIKGEHCIVTALFVCDHLGIKTNERFIVDTGTVHTTIPETRATDMGVNLETLGKYKVKIKTGGIGGGTDARLLGGIRLIFTGTDNLPVEEKLQSVHVLRNPPARNEEERNILRTIPCLLGLDIIRRFTLRFEEKNFAYFEREAATTVSS